MASPAIGIRRHSAGRCPTSVEIIDHPSPNFGERRNGEAPDLIVIHYTAMTSAKAALERLCDPDAEVSAHYLISEAGQTTRLVAEECRAWHAGAGAWGGRGDVNSRSLGIELANDGTAPFSARQMDALEHLLAGMLQRWDVPLHGVIAHSDMAPMRKSDPGPKFDWHRLARSGLSVWPGGQTDRTADFQQAARIFGYPQAEPEALLAAFRRRFRPWASGPLDAVDRAMISDLAARYPVDPDAASA